MANILVVDDDILFAAMLSLDLLRLGHRPCVVASAEAALDRLDADGSIDLVVTAIVTAELDGIELIQSIRQFDRAVPIIAISCGGTQPDSAIFTTARVLGVDRVVNKPVGTRVIATAILDLLAGPSRSGGMVASPIEGDVSCLL